MDLILRNGSIVTHAEEFIADIGIEGGKIKQIGQELGPAAREIDVGGIAAPVRVVAVDRDPRPDTGAWGRREVWRCGDHGWR